MTLSTAEKHMAGLAGEPVPADARQAQNIASRLQLQRIAPGEWDAAIVQFDGVVQEQLCAFAHHRWPNVVLEPWLLSEGDEIVGGAMMMVQNLPMKLGAIAVSKWGPIFKDHQRPDGARVYAEAIEALIGEYADRRGMMISVLPRAAAADANFELDYLIKRGFSAGSSLPFPDRYFVNLRLDDEAVLQGFGQKWRYHLKKAFKEDLSFEAAGPEQAHVFDALYQAMTNRKQFPDHSAYDDTFEALMAIEDEALRPKLFFVRKAGEIVAGAVIFSAGDTAVYLYGATNDAALPLRAGYFMHWQIIRWLRDNCAARWYDLGGTDGFQGLHQFKKGMVGQTGIIGPVPPVMNYASHWKVRILGGLAFAARDGLSAVIRVVERVRARGPKPDQERAE